MTPAANASTVADGNGTEGDGTAAQFHVITDGGVAFLLFQGSATQHHPLVHQHVITNLGSLTNDHARTVVNKETSPDFRAGMYFNAGQKAAEV